MGAVASPSPPPGAERVGVRWGNHRSRPGAADARARFARLCFALAAGRAGGIAGDLVAVAGDAAGAAPHRLSGEPPPALQPIRAADARAAVQALRPKPWPGDRAAALKRLEAMPLPQDSAAVWLSDGVDDGAAAALAAYLVEHGGLRYIAAAEGEAPRLVAAGELAAKDVAVAVRSVPASPPRPVTVRASGED